MPEPELMDCADEVDAYTSAAAQSHLEKIDCTFVDRLARLFPAPRERFTVLDVGCGPGQIPIMIAKRWPQARVTGIDAAPHMIEQAIANGSKANALNVAFEVFRVSQHSAASQLPFPDQSFDVVTCNSVVHHLSDPIAAFNEIARIVKPTGAVLIRDLRRPGRLTIAAHSAWFGRHYSGQMKRLFNASVRAAYTAAEMQSMLQLSKLSNSRTRVFCHGRTHLGIERSSL